MGSAVAMDNGLLAAVHDRLDRRIEQRVYQIGVRFGPYRPADDEAVGAVDDGRLNRPGFTGGWFVQ